MAYAPRYIDPGSTLTLPVMTDPVTVGSVVTDIPAVKLIDATVGSADPTGVAANPLKVSAASLPLPSGAATESTLSTANGKLPSLTSDSRVPVEVYNKRGSSSLFVYKLVTTSPTTLVAADSAGARTLAVTVFNTSTTQTLYVAYGFAASAVTQYSVQVLPLGYLEVPDGCVGKIVTGCTDSGTLEAYVTVAA